MLFETKSDINLLICPECHGTGIFGYRRCSKCQGMAMGHAVRGKWLFWSYPLERYHLALEDGRRYLNSIRRITFLALWLTVWLWLGFLIYKQGNYANLIFGLEYWWRLYEQFNTEMLLLFWLGVIFASYVFYRIVRERDYKEDVEHFDYNLEVQELENLAAWSEVLKLSPKKRKNIAAAFTNDAIHALGEAYRLADKRGVKSVLPIHLFCSLLTADQIKSVFIRLGIPVKLVSEKITDLLEQEEKDFQDNRTTPLVSPALAQVLFAAYEEAYQAHQSYVGVTDLLITVVESDAALQDFLFGLDIDKHKLINVVEWARIREKLYRHYLRFKKTASHRSKAGIDKAMTAIATPYLNNFSDDLTLLAQLGYLDEAINREKEMEEIFRIIDGGEKSVLLVGEHGVGKKTIIEGLAQKMVEDDVPDRLKDKRLVRLSVSSLLAGTTPAGAVERLNHIMLEVSRAGNVILFIHNIHELIGVSAGGSGGSLDVADTLAEYLNRREFLTLATTTEDQFAQNISNSTMGNVFSKVDIREMDENNAIQVLESKAGLIEYKHNVFFAYEAIEKAVKFATKFLHETCLPGSALQIITEAASYTKKQKGQNMLVTGEEVAHIISEKTRIPVSSITADESAKLMQLETEMHQRVIGQDEAVDLVANALRRARAEIRSTTKPIANFLFLGPTGVGKTELAKTIAAVYFGGEDKMIRFDMSEYQDRASVYRLIGAPGQPGTGLLTEAVKRNPFSLLLLDELEKADQDILNLFLQVMDDGRLTDSTGRTIDFTNVILIATSNAGTSYVSEQLKNGLSTDAIKDRLLHGELKDYFRPEFLNRFDGIVLFKSLEHDEIKQIASLMLKRIAKDLEAKGIGLEVEDAGLEFLVGIGFDPEFGARPMRRALQERIENQLAELILSGSLKKKDKVIIKAGGELAVSR